MSGRAKRTPKNTPSKNPTGDVEGTPLEKSPTRRSLRIRGAKAELDLGALEEIEKRNRRSRSRSASVSSQANNPSFSTQSLSTQDTLADDDGLASDISTLNDASELMNAGLNSTLRVDFNETASSGALSTPGSGEKRRSSTLRKADLKEIEKENEMPENDDKQAEQEDDNEGAESPQEESNEVEITDDNGEHKKKNRLVEEVLDDDKDGSEGTENPEEEESNEDEAMDDDARRKKKNGLDDEDLDGNSDDSGGAETPDDEESSDDETMDDDARRKKKNRLYEEDLEDEDAVIENRKRFKKSVVDDKFFSLAEMHEFMDSQDKLEEKRRLGKFDGSEKMIGLIEQFEAENLRPRTWELAGEVTAEERDKDELLDHFVDADFQAKSAPIITTETTEKLESIILKRIKDKSFDDVERKKRRDELVAQFRAKTSFEDTIRKSLADVYEEEFKEKQSDEVVEEPKLESAVEEIDLDMKKLFKKLDALSHYEFTPSQVRPEMKIVKNVASLRAEEVGPMASVEASSSLLAPEEVLKHVKAAPKAKEEMTTTDKKRLRRKKKVKQRVLASKGLMSKKEDENGEDGESSIKKRTTLKKKLKKRKVVGDVNTEAASTETIPKKKKKKVKKTPIA